MRHALLLGLFIGVGLTAAGTAGTPWIVGLLGLEGSAARMAEQYLGTLFLCMLPLVFIPIIDNALIGMGNTLLPMLMQLLSLLINFLLNPLLIYGARAAEHAPSDAVAPIASLAAHLASAFGLEEGLGMRGAALATVISRLVAVLLGLFCLLRLYRVRLVGAGRRPDFPLMRDILAISAPTALSIAFYAGVYWALLNLVLTGLGLYIPYVAFHTTLFERLIAAFREPGNIGFLMYSADAVGYLGYVTIMLLRNTSLLQSGFLSLFVTTSLLIAIAAIFITLCLAFHYYRRLPSDGSR